MWTGLEMERGRRAGLQEENLGGWAGTPHLGDRAGSVCRVPDLQVPEAACRGAGDRDPGDGREPGAAAGPAKRRELGISNHFSGVGRDGIALVPQQEGKLRRGPVPSLTF